MVTKDVRPRSPLSSWLARFDADFGFSPGQWIKGLLGSLAAFFYKLVTKVPVRLWRWLQHLAAGVAGVFRWLLVDSRRSPKPATRQSAQSAPRGARSWLRAGLGGSGMWFARLIFKSLDLISFGELLDTLTMLVKFNTRPLTEYEIRQAKKVFGNCLTYWRIRVDEWSLAAHIGRWVYEKRTGNTSPGMAITIFSTIRFTRRIDPENNPDDMAWLIHELMHAAQCEYVGGQFMLESLIAQSQAGYDYGGPASLSGKNFRDFNREQQGDIARDYYLHLSGQKTLAPHEAAEYERVLNQMRRGEM